mgnify:CR=1 FL=1
MAILVIFDPPISFMHLFLLIFAVAPHAGAWIEMRCKKVNRRKVRVAPHAGAWIEMCWPQPPLPAGPVAPHAGAWIEIITCLTISSQPHAAPRAGAWIMYDVMPGHGHGKPPICPIIEKKDSAF